MRRLLIIAALLYTGPAFAQTRDLGSYGEDLANQAIQGMRGPYTGTYRTTNGGGGVYSDNYGNNCRVMRTNGGYIGGCN